MSYWSFTILAVGSGVGTVRPGKQSRISPLRGKISEHSLLLSPRNFIGLQDRDCRSVRLTTSAQK
jgi:hypothetical protein